ncbi:DoxX family membrane protein [Pullulanibacillus sp. KACC 23026]|uniref:DoxX family membrane protein n=1 Tax=Pullulanibacillus sp. KACC 23026 TaxID=3028315 RepID=UPI0023B16E28|nr:DoxX family membrane protein [Pullulanibacillus sp. KACC 23026]WEG12220.1 DoxX family membrane protein [Pullulanibacillus sp. KACC 23026]
MLIHFLKTNRFVSLLLMVLRLYLGWQWLKAGWEKLSGSGFDARGFLYGAVKNMSGEHAAVQPWWGNFLKEFALPHVTVFNVIIPLGELLVGIGLILGILTSFSILMGLTMNFAYLLSGSTSTNPQMLLLGMVLLFTGNNAHKIGLDYWFIPLLNKIIKKAGTKQMSQSA